MNTYLPFLAPVLASILGSGFLGAWLVHRRLAPKTTAEARDITAAAMDRDWARFQREIDRLVKRCENAEDAAQQAVKGQRECEEREAGLLARIARLEGLDVARGEARQEAAGIVAIERLAERDKR
jgi:hypothetical protein